MERKEVRLRRASRDCQVDVASVKMFWTGAPSWGTILCYGKNTPSSSRVRLDTIITFYCSLWACRVFLTWVIISQETLVSVYWLVASILWLTSWNYPQMATAWSSHQLSIASCMVACSRLHFAAAWCVFSVTCAYDISQAALFGQTNHNRQHRSMWLGSLRLDYRPQYTTSAHKTGHWKLFPFWIESLHFGIRGNKTHTSHNRVPVPHGMTYLHILYCFGL